VARAVSVSVSSPNVARSSTNTPVPATAVMMTGRVTQVIRSRACGFIRAVDGQDVFFHASELTGIAFSEVEERLVVKFDLVHDPVSGPRATQVRVATVRARVVASKTGTKSRTVRSGKSTKGK
jgi:cold shock CspA family protein